jgi:hypothetical protein
MLVKCTRLGFPKLRPWAISARSEAPTSPKETGSSRAVSPARIFPSLVKALGFRVSAPASGTSTPELLASYDPATRSWKTSGLSLFEGLIAYSGALPRSGTMRNGKIYAPPMSERPTEGKGSGLWRTPCATDGDQEKGPRGDLIAQIRGWKGHLLPTPSAMEYGTNQGGGMGRTGPIRPSLGTMARKGLWPTPTKHNAQETGAPSQMERHTPQLGDLVGGQLNPTWVEWLLGYPLHWTEV